MKSDSISGNPLSLLKAIRRNSIIFGLFLILQGIILYATLGGGIYNAFVVIGTLMAFAAAGETVLRIFRQKKTLLNTLLCLALIFAIFVVIVVLIGMIAIPEVRESVMVLSVSLVAIFNGFINILESIRIEKNKAIRALIIVICVLCMGFGVAYWATYERAPDMLTRARGVIFILTGAINVWLGIRTGGSLKPEQSDILKK